MPDPKSSEITSRPPLVDVRGERGTPPGIAYVGRDDFLYVISNATIASQQIRIAGRLLGADGLIRPFVFVHSNNAAGADVTERFAIAEGFLLSVAAFPANNAPLRGQCFVELGILRGRLADLQIAQVLLRDYLTEDHASGAPFGRQVSSVEGPGWLRSLGSADPAAGAEASQTTPADLRWKPLTVRAALTTDATAANRFPRLELVSGADVLWRSHPHDAQIASQTRTYNWAVGGVYVASVAAGEHQNILPDLGLPAGGILRTSTDGIVAGDDWGALRLLVEELIED